MSVTAFVGACMTAGTGAPGQPTGGHRDLTRFRVFRMERQDVFGICVPMHAVYSASIRLQEDGRYLLRLAVLEEGAAGADDCAPYYMDESVCAVSRDLPERYVSEEEVERMQEVFGSVRPYGEPDEECEPSVASDPECDITYFIWDDLWTNDFVCEHNHLDEAQVSGILMFLEELRVD